MQVIPNIFYIFIVYHNFINDNMSSINQLVSEIAHVAQEPNNNALRVAIKREIIHARNELIRKSYNNHSITDKVLQQRFRLSIIDIPDGDLQGTDGLKLPVIKRTVQKVPRPTRLPHNVPFHSVRTAGVNNPHEIPFAKEASARFNNFLPGMCNLATYDYINEYIYIRLSPSNDIVNLKNIVIESVFEYPHIIEIETLAGKKISNEFTIDDDEFLLPEDLVGAVKDMVYQRLYLEIHRQTNETTEMNKLRG
jgi:hypothetical protein